MQQPILTLWSRYDDGALRKVRVIHVGGESERVSEKCPERGPGIGSEALLGDYTDPVFETKVCEKVRADASGAGTDGSSESGFGASVGTDSNPEKTDKGYPVRSRKTGSVLVAPRGVNGDGAPSILPPTPEADGAVGVQNDLAGSEDQIRLEEKGSVQAPAGGNSGEICQSMDPHGSDMAVSVGTLPVETNPVTKKRRSKVAWRYEVEDVDGTLWIYKTAKELLAALTGHPEGRHWTFDRYFGLGKYASREEDDEGLPTIFDILSPTNTLVKEIRLGIDLENRGDEVAKLLFARFGHIIHGCGYDPDDVLQEVYKGLLIRNKGTCQFDPRKASFGHYVNMVAEGVFCNLMRKTNRRKEKEQVGAPGGGDDVYGGSVDASESMYAEKASITVAEKEGGPMGEGALEDLSRFLAKRIEDGDGELALKASPLVHAGYGRSEIAERLGVSKIAVSKALTCLRKVAREWAA